jgi:succinyl-CoA synthetase beta subunit
MFIKSHILKRAPTSRILTSLPVRNLNLHEYISKNVMREYGIQVQKGELATTPEEAESIAKTLSNKGGLILKCQVQAGGRGKGHLTSGLKGGVKIV